MFKLNPISLYIHIPWCLKKCGYCDFYSYVSQEMIPEKKYIENLLKDFEKDMLSIHNKTINTIFIGGGTPSLLNHTSIKKLIHGIKERACVAKNTEITIESNPKTIECQRLLDYKNAGINRFSLGVQTFNSTLLKKIERTYDLDEAIHSIQILKKISDNVNLDLMYGLPDQTLEESLIDLKYAIQFNPCHISWYQLSIEPNTIFYAKKLNIPNEDVIFQIYREGDKLLQKVGYKKYEISSYCKNSYQCQHNLNYWNFGDYIGIGCGAHGKITKNNGQIIRTLKNKNIKDFLNGNYLDSINIVTKKDKIIEYFMNTGRLYKPILKKHFREKTYINENTIENKIEVAVKNGFLVNRSKYWKTTKRGKLFLNSLLQIFL